MSTELAKQNVTFLPCPCCGSDFVNFCTVVYSAQTVREQEWPQNTFFYVKCGSCLLNNLGNVGFRTREEAAMSWNRRQNDDVPERVKRAYRERAIVAVLAVKMALDAGYKAGKGQDKDAPPDAWTAVLYVDFPGGQISWHIASADEDLLVGLPDYGGAWDGTFESRTGERVVSWRPSSPDTTASPCLRLRHGEG